MSITRLDIKDQCFGVTQLSEVTEIALTNRGIHDLGCLSRECPNLTELNLGFNALAALQGLQTLTSLKQLNLSHNQLAALKGMSSLTNLTSLNVSHNKISSISGLSACVGLTDLWLQNNQIRHASELSMLSALSSLERMVLAPNPVCTLLPSEVFRPLVVALSSSLQVLNGQPVTAADREAASSINVHEHITPPALPPTTPPRAPSSVASERGLQRHSAPASTSSSAPRSPAQPVRNGLPGQRGRLPARAAGLPKPRKQLLSDIGAQPSNQLSQEGPQAQSDTGEGRLSSTRSDDDLLSLLSDASTLGAGQGRRKAQPTSKHIPRIKELPAESQFNAVLAMLPTFDTSKLPRKYSPTKIMETLPRKPPPPKPPPEAGIVEGELRYPAGSRGRAVTVLGDGAVTSCWPNGSMAVNVDANHATVPPTYNMFACFQTGNLAVSWDNTGGFVQYPSGAVCINYSSGTRAGTLFAPNGDVLLKWKDEVSADAATSTSGNTPPIDMALDANYGVRFSRATQQLDLYMCCDGVRFKFVCARNSLSNTWDTPKGRTSRHTGLRVAAEGVRAQGGKDGEDAVQRSTRPSSPPPAFLGQLVAGNTAGATQLAMAKLMKSDASEGTGTGAPNGMPDVAADAAFAMAAVTRALKALDAGLFRGLGSQE